jgi:hypothetical protein
MINRLLAYALVGCTAALIGACKKPAVEAYRVPKETAAQTSTAPAAGSGAGASAPAAAPAMGGSMANTPVATASGPALTWTAPAHWAAKPTGAMRKGSYTVTGPGGEGDMSISAFPGDVGGDLANVNRWRDQVKLPPITQAQLESSTEHVDRNGLHMTVVDLIGTGSDAKRILGVIVPHAGGTWFFKLIGPEPLVAKEKAAFTAFIDTIKPAAQ